jgi:IPT/TIG domain
VTRVVTTHRHKTLNGTSGAADTGGTAITISGTGFTGQVGVIEFNDAKSPFSGGTQYRFTVASDRSLRTRTVQQNPALADVQVCTVTGCSPTVKTDKLYLYPPGNPHVTSVSPSSGKAAGGTKVTIHGNNLGCAIGVFFGSVKARSFTQTPALLDCGSTVVLRATSPKGKAGAKVSVRVETIESYFAGAGHGVSSAKFSYK